MYYNRLECEQLAINLNIKPAFLYTCLKLTKDYNNYKAIKIPKKDGSYRVIMEPNKKLKIIQRKIVEYLKNFQKEKFCAYGFIKGKSNVDNAKIHVNKKYIYKIDLKDYFPSIMSGRIFKMFSVRPFSFSRATATILTNLICFNNTLAQGFPSSPYISNIITRRLDNSLLKLAKKYKCNYTRYADDITFSTNLTSFPYQLTDEIKVIINNEMFTINEKKTKILSSNTRQIVTGIVVNKKTNLKRNYYRELRQILYYWNKKGDNACCTKNGLSIQKLHKYILGKLAYYKSIVGENNNCYLRLCAAYNSATNSQYFKVPIKHELIASRYILKTGNLKEAGSSAGNVLEKFLQSLCLINNIQNITVNGKNQSIMDTTIDPLKNILKSNNIINSVQAKEIEKLNSIRIICSHSKKTSPSYDDIIDIINGTEKIILDLS